MPKSVFRAVLVAATLVTIPVAFAAAPAPAEIAETAKGKTLTDAKGMTLYVFDQDIKGKSVCNGPCAVNWPPFFATSSAKADGDYSIVKRDDGKAQWAYKDRPLYTWKNDKKPGDITGDGFLNNTWHIAAP